MTNKKDEIIKPNNLDYLIEKLPRIGSLTTSDVANILQISQQNVIRACNDDWLQHYKVPGSRHRRITVEQLVSSLRNNWNDFDNEYPQRLLLHFMEVLDLNPADYGLNGLVGKGGLRFHVQEGIYTTGKVDDLIGRCQQTVIRSSDSGRIEGYTAFNTNFRRIPAGAVIRYTRENGITLDESVKIATSPELITYPDPIGNKKEEEIWVPAKDRVAYRPDVSQSVWYRFNDVLSEFSIRVGENSGLYVKFIETRKDPIIYIILLDNARFNPAGKPLCQKEHIGKIAMFLGIGSSLLKEYPTDNIKDQKDQIESIRNKVHNRFYMFFQDISKIKN